MLKPPGDTNYREIIADDARARQDAPPYLLLREPARTEWSQRALRSNQVGEQGGNAVETDRVNFSKFWPSVLH